MTGYVAGFLFDVSLMNVALIRKEKPAWQRGLLNGIGGKIEPGETADVAMRREFYEEAGMDLETWRPFATLIGDSWTVHFYYAIGNPNKTKTMTEEEVVVVNLGDIDNLPLMTNLAWLIPMAQTLATGAERAERFVITEIAKVQPMQ